MTQDDGLVGATDDDSEWALILAQSLVEAGVRVVATVPDGATSKVYARLPKEISRPLITREEEGVGILSGAYLSGRLGALLIQNTGLGNAINGLAGYAIPAGIPMLLIVTLRGDLGEFSGAQVPIGLATEPILTAMGIPVHQLRDRANIRQTIVGAMALSIAGNRPVAVILRTALTGGKE